METPSPALTFNKNYKPLSNFIFAIFLRTPKVDIKDGTEKGLQGPCAVGNGVRTPTDGLSGSQKAFLGSVRHDILHEKTSSRLTNADRLHPSSNKYHLYFYLLRYCKKSRRQHPLLGLDGRIFWPSGNTIRTILQTKKTGIKIDW